MSRTLLALLLLLTAQIAPAWGQSGVTLQEGSATLGRATTLRCGDGITCSLLGGTGILTGTSTGSPPGGASGSLQYNNSGAFGGVGLWNGTTLAVPPLTYLPGSLAVTSVGPLTFEDGTTQGFGVNGCTVVTSPVITGTYAASCAAGTYSTFYEPLNGTMQATFKFRIAANPSAPLLLLDTWSGTANLGALLFIRTNGTLGWANGDDSENPTFFNTGANAVLLGATNTIVVTYTPTASGGLAVTLNGVSQWTPTQDFSAATLYGVEFGPWNVVSGQTIFFDDITVVSDALSLVGTTVAETLYAGTLGIQAATARYEWLINTTTLQLRGSGPGLEDGAGVVFQTNVHGPQFLGIPGSNRQALNIVYDYTLTTEPSNITGLRIQTGPSVAGTPVGYNQALLIDTPFHAGDIAKNAGIYIKDQEFGAQNYAIFYERAGGLAWLLHGNGDVFTYRTDYTHDQTNYEGGGYFWNHVENKFYLGTTKGGTGTLRPVGLIGSVVTVEPTLFVGSTYSSSINGGGTEYRLYLAELTGHTNDYYLWVDAQHGVLRIRDDNTFNSVHQAIIALYNPQFPKYTPGAADYERIVLGQWNSNVAEIGAAAGGTGTLRALRLIGASYKLSALTSNGFVKTSGGDGSLSVDTSTYLTTAVTSLAGTANQITASASTGSVTLSLPAALTVPGSLTVTTTTGTPSTFATLDSGGKIVAGATYATPAPVSAKYITQEADSTLSAEQSLGALTTGLTLNTVTGSTGVLSAYSGTSCTNQFPRSLNASGAATCATVANTDLTNSSVTVNGTSNQINTTSASVALGGSATLSLSSTLVAPGTVTVTTRTGTPSTLATFDSGGQLVAGSSLAGNPWVGPTTATGGLIGGGIGAAVGATNLFSGQNSITAFQVVPIAAGSGGWVRNLAMNYAAAQATGAHQLFGISMNIAYNVTPIPWGPQLAIPSGAAAGVYSAPLLYRVGGPTTIALSGVQANNLSGVAATTPTGWTAELILDDGGLMLSGFVNGNVATTTTVYTGPFAASGTTTQQATHDPSAWVSPITGTLKNLCFMTSTTQDASGSMVLTAFVNGSATSLVATQAAGALAGIFCDYTNTAAVTANQAVTVRIVNNATTGTQTLKGWSMSLVPSSGTPGVIGGFIGAIASNTTTYYKPFTSVSNATETNVQVPLARAGTTTNLCVNVSTASGFTGTATLMKNGSATSLAVTTTASTTGVSCATGSVSWAQNDRMSLRIVQANGGGTTFSGWSVDY